MPYLAGHTSNPRPFPAARSWLGQNTVRLTRRTVVRALSMCRELVSGGMSLDDVSEDLMKIRLDFQADGEKEDASGMPSQDLSG